MQQLGGQGHVHVRLHAEDAGVIFAQGAGGAHVEGHVSDQAAGIGVVAVPAAARRGGKRLRRAVRGGQGRQQGRVDLGLTQPGVDQGFGGGPLIQPGGQGGGRIVQNGDHGRTQPGVADAVGGVAQILPGGGHCVRDAGHVLRGQAPALLQADCFNGRRSGGGGRAEQTGAADKTGSGGV